MTEQEFRQRVIGLRRKMFAVAVRIGLQQEDAADVVQETLLRLWRSRNGLPDVESELSAYCLRTLHNECISFIRRRRPFDQLKDSEINSFHSDTLESSDSLRHIERMIDSLPENQRIVMKLKTFSDFDNLEIEEATGLSQDNIRKLLSRARKRLRILFNQIK